MTEIDQGVIERCIRAGCTAADYHLACSWPECSCKAMPASARAALAASGWGEEIERLQDRIAHLENEATDAAIATEEMLRAEERVERLETALRDILIDCETTSYPDADCRERCIILARGPLAPAPAPERDG